MMHSTMQQTPLFTNHDLHHRFYIHDVNNVMNSSTKDWATWLTNIQAQLVSNFEEVQRRYKENVDKHYEDQPNFKVKDRVWL
jgi:hypothetical protein